MVSSDLYHIKQQFVLGAYQSLVQGGLPDVNSPDYLPALLYKSRAYIGLNDPKSALSTLPSGSDNIAIKAVSSLARYVGAKGQAEGEAALEELRDLCVEIEGDDADGSDEDKALVKVLAGTAFARAGEVEEALDTLGTDTEDLEAVSVIVQLYLSINRPDLAKKQFDRSKNWAEDDLLLQQIEATIGLVTGKDNYNNTTSFYTEQLGNPSLSSPHLLTSRGVARILRGEIQEAKSDLEEALEQQKGEDVEAQAASIVAGGLGALKGDETEGLWSAFVTEHPSHPAVLDVQEKSALFDQHAAAFTIPPLASTVQG